MKQTNSKSNSSAIVTVFSVILFLLILVVFAIQLSIIISYFITMNYGRCVYNIKDGEETTCYCDYTTKNQCDDFNGVYNDQLGCENNFVKDCVTHHLPTPTATPM